MENIINSLETAKNTKIAPIEETIYQQLIRFSQSYNAIIRDNQLTFGIRKDGPENFVLRVYSPDGRTVLFSDTITRKNSIMMYLRESGSFNDVLINGVSRMSDFSGLLNDLGLEMGVAGATFKHPEPTPVMKVVKDMPKEEKPVVQAPIDLITLIESTGISAAKIAERIGITRGTFNNKLKGNKGEKFTADQDRKIREVVQDMITQMQRFLTN